jgi:hypothetical protein
MSTQLLDALDSLETRLKTDQRETNDRLLMLEQKGSAWPGEFSAKPISIGDQFVKAFQANSELFAKTKSVRLEIKAAGDPVTTTSGRNLIQGGVGAPGLFALGFQNALPTRQVPNTSAVEYSRFTGVTGAAARHHQHHL